MAGWEPFTAGGPGSEDTAGPSSGVTPSRRWEASRGYPPLVARIVEFFETRVPPVDPATTLEIYVFMEAADESKRRGGVAGPPAGRAGEGPDPGPGDTRPQISRKKEISIHSTIVTLFQENMRGSSPGAPWVARALSFRPRVLTSGMGVRIGQTQRWNRFEKYESPGRRLADPDPDALSRRRNSRLPGTPTPRSPTCITAHGTFGTIAPSATPWTPPANRDRT